MNSDETAKMAGLNSPEPGERTDRTKRLAIWAAMFAAVSAFAAVASAYFHHQRNSYEIENKVFDVRAEDDWSILIEQIGGPLYQIQTITLIPTFQERVANKTEYVDGAPIEVPLRSFKTSTGDAPTRYVIDKLQTLLCPPYTQQPKLRTCSQTALWLLEIKFDVSGERRTYVCRPGQCASS